VVAQNIEICVLIPTTFRNFKSKVRYKYQLVCIISDKM